MAGFQSQRKGRRVLRKLVLFAIMLLVVWSAGLVRFAGSLPLDVEQPDRRTDAIIVLTGGSGRLEEGLDLLARDMADRLFVSGVYQGVDVKTLFTMFQRNPQELEMRVGIGTASNTTGNATETAVWAHDHQVKSLRLVTAAYHMPRSLLEFDHALPEVDIIAHPVFPEHVKVKRWWAWSGTTALIAGEYNKFMLAWLRQLVEKLSTTKAGEP